MPICDFRRGMLNARLRARIQHLLPGHRLAQHIPQFPVFDSSERQRAFRLSYSAYSKVVFGKWQFSGLIKTSFKKKNQRTNTIFSERGLNASPQANIQPAVIESQIQVLFFFRVLSLASGDKSEFMLEDLGILQKVVFLFCGILILSRIYRQKQ